MSGLLNLVRPEIRAMRPYRSAVFEDGLVRLNANENPWRPPGDDSERGLNWYPEPRPATLQRRLAAHYGVDPDRLLVTRGSSEAIDLVIRAFCRAGTDSVVLCPPTFGMYEVYAQVQDARVRAVPLLRQQGYALDVEGIVGQWTESDKLVFVCSPNNPTGNRFPTADVADLAGRLRGRGCIVLDAAYAEFSTADDSLVLQERFDNLLVLRTLSKAMALAGVRCGALIGPAEVVDAVGCVLPPYTFPVLCADAVTRCLEPETAAEWQRRVAVLKNERERMARALASLPVITRVWPSDANFLLVESRNPQALVGAARKGGIMLRDFSWDPYLPGCVRITIGTPEQNRQLIEALS
jgi:histidinol-phosphate aminotransferase